MGWITLSDASVRSRPGLESVLCISRGHATPRVVREKAFVRSKW